MKYIECMTYVSIVYDESIHLLANVSICLHVSVSVGQNPKLTIVSYKSQPSGNISFAVFREKLLLLIKMSHNISLILYRVHIKSGIFFNKYKKYIHKYICNTEKNEKVDLK